MLVVMTIITSWHGLMIKVWWCWCPREQFFLYMINGKTTSLYAFHRKIVFHYESECWSLTTIGSHKFRCNFKSFIVVIIIINIKASKLSAVHISINISTVMQQVLIVSEMNVFTAVGCCSQSVLSNTTIWLYLTWPTFWIYCSSSLPHYLIPRSAIVYDKARELGNNTMKCACRITGTLTWEEC